MACLKLESLPFALIPNLEKIASPIYSEKIASAQSLLCPHSVFHHPIPIEAIAGKRMHGRSPKESRNLLLDHSMKWRKSREKNGGPLACKQKEYVVQYLVEKLEKVVFGGSHESNLLGETRRKERADEPVQDANKRIDGSDTDIPQTVGVASYHNTGESGKNKWTRES